MDRLRMTVAETNGDGTIRYRLYNPRSFIVLGLLFTFWLPGVLYAINEGHQRNRTRRNWLIVLFSVLMLALLSLLLANRELGRRTPWGTLGMNAERGRLLYSLQMPAHRRWLASGQKPKSLLLRVVIAGVPLLLVTVVSIAYVAR